MIKEKQDFYWACLPKEVRSEIRQNYAAAVKIDYISYTMAFNDLFGYHNLNSDTEPEEVLMVKKSKVVELYKKAQSDDYIITPNGAKLQLSRGIKVALKILFGDKCFT